MTILITGEKSYIGKKFISKLKKKKINFDIYKKKKKKKYTHLFHFSFQKKIKKNNIENFFIKNSEDFDKIIDFCKKNKIKLIFPSSANYFPSKKPHKEDDDMFVYNLYNQAKIICEEKILLTKKNLKYSILRIFNVYGQNGHSFVDNLIRINKKKKVQKKYNLNDVLDFIHIDDLINALEKTLYLKKNFILNIGYGKSYSQKTIFNLLKKKGINYNQNFYTDKKNCRVVKSNISLAKKKLKWKPNISLLKYAKKISNS